MTLTDGPCLDSQVDKGNESIHQKCPSLKETQLRIEDPSPRSHSGSFLFDIDCPLCLSRSHNNRQHDHTDSASTESRWSCLSQVHPVLRSEDVQLQCCHAVQDFLTLGAEGKVKFLHKETTPIDRLIGNFCSIEISAGGAWEGVIQMKMFSPSPAASKWFHGDKSLCIVNGRLQPSSAST